MIYEYQAMKILAPAKINLSLRVVGKRADGFHDIETVMVGVTLTDELGIVIPDRPGLGMTCDDPGVPTDEGNLVIQAAREFFVVTGQEPRAEFHLIKRIPWGAGLGGGSSDAAAALKLLDQAFGAGLGDARLEEIAAKVGSDVAWFIRLRPAVCRGRGEIVEPLVEPPPALRLILFKPPFAVPTPWAYRRWSEMRPPPACARIVSGFPLFNDLEVPVFEKYVLLRVLRDWVEEQPGVVAAAMSGSGSTIFAIMDGESDGKEIVSRVQGRFGSTIRADEVSLLRDAPMA